MLSNLRKKRVLAGFEPMASEVRVEGVVEGKYLVLREVSTNEMGEPRVKERGKIPMTYLREWVRDPASPTTVLVMEIPGTEVLDTLDATFSDAHRRSQPAEP